MARVFYDTFTKEDQPVGPEYTIISGAFSYASNALRATSSGWVTPAILDPLENACQVVTVLTPSAFTRSISLKFRGAQDDADHIVVAFSLQAAAIAVSISEKVNGSSTTHASRTWPYTWGTSADLQVSVFNETCVVWIDGFEVLATRVPNVSGAGLTPMYLGSNGPYADYWAIYEYTGNGYSLSVDSGPDVNGYYTLTLHNAGREWTVGTPGSPVFSAQSGNIISQEVTDVDTAVVLWEPVALWAEELIHDPLNGYSVSFGISAPPGETGPSGGGGGLTETQGETIDDLANFLADYQAGGGHVQGVMLKLGGMSLLAGSAYSEGDGTAFGDVLDAVLGTETGLAIIKNRIDLIRDTLDALTDTEGYTLPSVQEAIRGTSSRDLTQVYNLVAGLTPADQTDVTEILNAIAAIRTANLWTLHSVKEWIEAIDVGDNADVLNELTLIRTANAWTLGHVMDAIAAIEGTDWSGRFDDVDEAVAAIPTDPIRSLTPVTDAISSHNTTSATAHAAILAAIALIPTDPVHDLTEDVDAIASALSAVAAAVSAAAAVLDLLKQPQNVYRPPVWPGQANATMGEPVALAPTLSVNTPCHGVIVSITSDPLNHGLYPWGAINQHPRAAYISFTHDSGAQEDVQPISFPSECIVPKMCQQASGFLVRCRAGLVGSVTPWVYASP